MLEGNPSDKQPNVVDAAQAEKGAWRARAESEVLNVRLFGLMSSDSDYVGRAYEKAGDFKAACEWYLMYGGGISDYYRILREQSFTEAEIAEIRNNAADRLEDYAIKLGNDSDYFITAIKYREFAAVLRSGAELGTPAGTK